VLHVHSGNLFGGIETMHLAIARHPTDDWLHTFALSFPGRLADALEATHVRLTRLPPARLSRLWTVRRTRRDLLALVRRERPDVVLCHSPWGMAVFGPGIREAGVPLALWLHGPLSRRSWLDRLAARHRPDLLICNSRYTATTALAAFPALVAFPALPASAAAPAAVPIIHPPAELRTPERAATRQNVRRLLGVDPAVTVILCASRPEPWKGHRVLLSALGRMAGSRAWTCWIAGGAQRRAEARYLRGLERAAARLGIADRVRFLGERSDVPELMAAADILCQPNEAPEPFGLVFAEALAIGLPVVTSDLGGAREIVTPECGVLVSPRDAGALAARLEPLVSVAQRRADLGAHGPARARELCDPARQLRRLGEALDTLVSRRIEFARPTA
jgi:glycosyltransferase involved in cell wall biosynthesis